MANPIVRNVTTEEAYGLVTQGRVLVLDVREVYEFNLGHIKGAINIPWTQINRTVDSIIPNKNTPILLHCLSGSRSQRALRELLNHGYTNIYHMTSGISGWHYGLER
jgi:rhodanese-related sulfurtransferase